MSQASQKSADDMPSNAMTQKLWLLYGSPSKDAKHARALVAEYVRLLTQYSEGELLAGADRLVKTRRFKSWPTVGDCIETLEDHRAEMHAKNAPELKIARPHPDWSPEAISAADKLVRSEMGRRAAREGWILGLHDYCRKHRELPSPYQTGGMIETARFVDRVAAGAVLNEPDKNKGTPQSRLTVIQLNASMMKMAASFLERRETLASAVLGESTS